MKGFFRRVLAFFNIGIYFISKKEKAEQQKLDWIRAFKVNTVIDIGANIGQFSKEARELFPSAHIYSFEPLPKCFKQLEDQFANDSTRTLFNYGLGEEDMIVEINEHEFTPSSSMFETNELLSSLMPFTSLNSHKTKIAIKRLDSFADQIEMKSPVMIKIDVQGYEKKVIGGAGKFLGKADYVFVEMTFVPIYKDQPLFDEIYTLLKEKGFEFRGYFPAFENQNDGTILCCDGIFIKKKG